MKEWKGIQKMVAPGKVVWVCQCEDPNCILEIELSPGERYEISKRNRGEPGSPVYLIHPDCKWGRNEIKIGLYQLGEESERFVVQKRSS